MAESVDFAGAAAVDSSVAHVSRRAPRTAERRTMRGGGAAKRQRRVSAGSAYGACPLCGRSVHLALLEGHAASCSPAAGAGTEGKGKGVAEGAAEVSAKGSGVEAGPCGEADRGRDAFAVLIRAQKSLRVERVRFHLERDRDTGAFSWRWGAHDAFVEGAGWDSSAAAWGAEVDVAVRGLRARVSVTTNLRPAGPGEGWAQVGARARPRPSEEPCSAALLKSALQKNVRRCRPGPAARCAARLAAVDPKGLVRRLPVILVEDALPHPSLPLLAWLLLADARGYCPGEAHLAEVVAVAADAARVPFRLARDGTALPEADRSGADGPGSPEESSLARSLRMRAAYGGTSFDVAMLLDAADRCASDGAKGDRLLRDVYAREQQDPRILPWERGGDEADDVPEEAVDQHCSGILSALQATCPDVSSERAARAIWEMSSGVSHKHDLPAGADLAPDVDAGRAAAGARGAVDPDVADTWCRIEPAVRSYQRRVLFARQATRAPHGA